MIIRGYYEKLHANKLDTLSEIDKVSEIFKLPKLTQEEAENLNRPIIRDKIYYLYTHTHMYIHTYILLTKKSPRSDDSIIGFY